MALGFRPFLLTHIKNITQENTPQYKIEPVGFMNFLQSQNKPQILRLDNAAGHKNTVQIKYKQRWTKDFTKTTLGCDNVNVPAYQEVAVTLTSTRQIAIHIDDETIAQYEDDASKTVMLGLPATPMMNEFLEEIFNGASAILEGVNEDLMTILMANIGNNRRTGTNTSQTINIGKDGTKNPLDNGLTQILTDYKTNLGVGTPQIVGSGLFFNYMIQQAALSANQSGLDTSILAAGVKFYHDLAASTVMGANQVTVIQPNAVQIVEYMQYTGFKAGVKPGASIYGVMALPMQLGQEILPVMFDWQLKYFDCPTTITDSYYGTTLNISKGYNLIISKQSGLFTIPASAYRGTDKISGNRGTLRYTITNTCDNC